VSRVGRVGGGGGQPAYYNSHHPCSFFPCESACPSPRILLKINSAIIMKLFVYHHSLVNIMLIPR
jgi:hypothetical protein